MKSSTQTADPSITNSLLVFIAALLAALLLVQIGAGSFAVGIIGVILITGVIGVGAVAVVQLTLVPFGKHLSRRATAPTARPIDKAYYRSFVAVCWLVVLSIVGLAIGAVRTQYVAGQASILCEQVLDSFGYMRHEEAMRGGPSDGFRVAPAVSSARFANTILQVLQRRPYDYALEVHGSGETAYVTNKLGNDTRVSVQYVGEYDTLEYQFTQLAPTVCRELLKTFAASEMAKQFVVNGTVVKKVNSPGVAQQYNAKQWEGVCDRSPLNSVTMQF